MVGQLIQIALLVVILSAKSNLLTSRTISMISTILFWGFKYCNTYDSLYSFSICKLSGFSLSLG